MFPQVNEIQVYLPLSLATVRIIIYCEHFCLHDNPEYFQHGHNAERSILDSIYTLADITSRIDYTHRFQPRSSGELVVKGRSKVRLLAQTEC